MALQELDLPQNAPFDDGPLVRVADRIARIGTTMAKLSAAAPVALRDDIEDLADAFAGFSPVISVMGSPESGKTALINALVGFPGLLPEDLPAWAAPLAAVHLNVAQRSGDRAVFNLCDATAWDVLGTCGGEAEAHWDLVSERLGPRIETLFGASHRFDGFDSDLLTRYLRPDAPETTTPNGKLLERFAGLVSKLDLLVEAPSLRIPILMRDLPAIAADIAGRDAAVLEALGETHLCLAVLPASEILDDGGGLEVLRFLQGFDPSQVILAIGAIDELEDMGPQLELIGERVADELSCLGFPADLPLYPVSAQWAGIALSGRTEQLTEARADSLAKALEAKGAKLRDPLAGCWRASGLGSLIKALGLAIEAGPAAQAAQIVAEEGAQLARRSRALIASGEGPSSEPGLGDLDEERLQKSFDPFAARCQNDIGDALGVAWLELQRKLRDAMAGYVEAEEAALCATAPASIYVTDTSPLQTEMLKHYRQFLETVRGAARGVFASMALGLGRLYCEVLGAEPDALPLEPPVLPEPRLPEMMGRQIRIGGGAPSLKKLIARRRGGDPRIEELRRVICADGHRALLALEHEHVQVVFAEIRRRMHDYLNDHGERLTAIARGEGGEERARLRRELGLGAGISRQLEAITACLAVFDRLQGEAERQSA